MNLKALLFCVPILLLASMALGQRAIVKGKITGQQSKEPLTGATVLLSGTNNSTITNLNGEYQFYVNSGDVNLTVRYLGFRDTILTVNLKEGELKVLNVALSDARKN